MVKEFDVKEGKTWIKKFKTGNYLPTYRRFLLKCNGETKTHKKG